MAQGFIFVWFRKALNLTQAAFYGIVLCGIRSLRVWVGPLSSTFCQVHSQLTRMTFFFCLCILIAITIARFFYIVVWKSVRQMNDNLLARIVLLQSGLLAFFYCIARPTVQVILIKCGLYRGSF